jgi:hypothetical protein
MFRLLVRMAFGCALALTLFSGFILAWRYDTTVLLATLPNQPDCPKPCWQHIRPGITSRNEAINLLAQNAWIGEITADDSQIQWTWSGQQSAIIDAKQPGRIVVRDDRVNTIQIKLNIGLGDLVILLGNPLWSTTHHANASAVVHLSFPREYLTLSLTMRCPTYRATFWQARPEIRLQANPSVGSRFTPEMLGYSVTC